MSAALDTDVLIIGAGPSGLGTAVQLIRKSGFRNFQIIEKVEDVGGTWLVNTYSTLLAGTKWEVTITNHKTKETSLKRARVVVSAVGSLSVPKECEIPGVADFKGPLFHSALWDRTFDWKDKNVVVLGNGCSATQFVPVMAESSQQITQFARQAHFLAERPNPVYTPAFRAIMRYVPFAMRLYRLKLYAGMEKDFAGFDIESGASIRADLKAENERYVRKMAPERYWDALIPRHEIGCKRKVMDTDYLSTLHRSNVELISSDPAVRIHPTGVLTASGRSVPADAIVLATGFSVHRMLSPMQITGQNNTLLATHWDTAHEGAAQAYLGTCIPGFPNFFTLMGPNTVTGHLSVIYTVKCQINFMLSLLEPIISPPSPLVPRFLFQTSQPTSVAVKAPAAAADSDWMQAKLRKLVWSSGCTSWALHPESGINIAMYPEFQFMFWLRSVFITSKDFEYTDSVSGERRSLVVGGWRTVRRALWTMAVVGVVGVGVLRARRAGRLDGVQKAVGGVFREVSRMGKRLTSG